MVGLLTRRGALGGGATVGLLAALGLGSCAVGGTSPAFAAAVNALASARRREDEHEERVLAPALAAYKRAVDAVPHRRTAQSFVNAFGEVRDLSTEDDVVVGSAQRFMTWSDIETFDPDWVAAHRELIVLADERSAECRRIRTEHRIDALHEEASHLSGLSGAALEAVLETPAATITDLIAKLKFIEDEELFEESAHAAIFADVRRLAGVA